MILYAVIGLFLSISLSNSLGKDLFDAYLTLGVEKDATKEQIKQAYRKLALDFHPDRNPDPKASDVFIRINQAYEILSDEENRRKYDRVGMYDDNRDRLKNDFDNLFNFAFNGENKEANMFYEKYRLNPSLFEDIKKNSHKRPYLFYVYSKFCYACIVLEPVMREVVRDLEPLGYGFGTVDYLSDGRIFQQMSVYQLPSIIALVDGYFVSYNLPKTSRIDSRSIKQFARDVLPDSLIKQIKSYPQIRRFLEQWSTTNKISVLILGTKKDPRMKHIIAAMKNQAFANFGYVHLGHTSSEITELRKALEINCHDCENALIFKDEPENGYAARVSALSGHSVPSNVFHRLIDQNKLLPFPRMSSNDYIDELCPISSAKNAKQCLIFLLPENQKSRRYIKSVRAALKSIDLNSTLPNIHFSHVYTNRQTDFVSAFKPSEYDEASDYYDVVILWRYDTMWGKYLKISSSIFQFKEFLDGKIVKHLVTKLMQSGKTTKFGALIDENASSVFVKFSKGIALFFRQIKNYFANDDLVQVLSVCGTLLLILLAGCLLNYFSSSHDKAKPADSGTSTTNELLTEQDWHPDDPKSSVSPEEKQNRVTQHIWKMMAPLIHELRAETYFGLIRLLKPGCRSVIILVDSDSKDRLLPTFARNIYNIRNNKTFSFGYLMTDKNLPWFRSLLELTLPDGEEPSPGNDPNDSRISIDTGSTDSTYATEMIPDFTTPLTGPSDNNKNIFSIPPNKIPVKDRLKGINPKQTLGTVLVICGWKLYFCMYHPMHCPTSKNQNDSSGSDSEDSYSFKPHTAKNSLKNRKRRESIARKRASKIDTVLDGFPMFLDRLYEGSVRRYYIPEWPENLK